MGKTAAATLIQYEVSTTSYDEALTDSGDHTVFTGTAEVWSNDNEGGFAPVIKPDGIVTGTNLITPHADNNKVSYAAFTAYVAGELITVSASTATITRASTGTHIINSIVCDYAGTITVVAGAEGTSFSTTRGGNGGPPYIPAGKIEIGQIKTSSQTAAAITANEIFQSPNDYTQERYNYPMWYSPRTLGFGNQADDSDKEHAHLEFMKALDTRHTDDVTKKIYVEVYEPDFADLEETTDWVPAEASPSASSKQKHRITTATVTKSLGSASLKVYWEDPITHPFRKLEGHTLTFKVFPDENLTGYELTQGSVGFKSFNPVADDMGADVTIAATTATVRFDS